MKNKIFSSILLDVGGTTIKGNAVVDGLTILPQMIVVPSISSYSKEEIILNIYRTIERIKENALIDTIDGISFAFPGPFDYEKGISYIKDVGKYDSLYKTSIEKELKKIDSEGILTHSSFIFMNDIDAFSYGVLEEYETLKEGKTLFIAIGTGTGSSFSIDGIIRTEGEGIPQNGWIYSIPYKESIVDDYISARGLENIAEEVMGRRLDGSSLTILASYGNKEAVKVYKKFGRTIGEALLPIINTFNPERIVFGGNITKANKFFAPSLKSVVDIPVIFVEETSFYTFKGLERAQRKSMEYKYDKHPLIDCRKYGHSISDRGEIVSELKKKEKLIVELYPGVDKKKILSIFSSLQYDTVIDTEALKKENSLLVKEFEEYITDDRVFGYMCPRDMDTVFDKEKLNKAKEAASKEGSLLVIGTGASLVTTDGTIVYCDISRWEIELRYRKGLSNWLISNSPSPSLQKFKIGYFIEWRMADKLKMAIFEDIAYFLDTHSEIPLMVKGQCVRDALNSIPSSPFRLEPYFDPGVWGGQWMKKKFNLPEGEKNYAWSFDGVPEENAINLLFEGGEIKLPAIDAVLYTPERLLGSRVYGRYGAEFPIRFDFLDTIGEGTLSLQVHPMTSYIQKKFGMHYTQDESYYILDADENASVYLGVKTGTDKDEMIKGLEEAEKGDKPFEAEKFVNRIGAEKHDHFLIPAGTVHCSGKGSMVLEISSTPYIFTFKLWDWGRVGLDGIPRPVHINHGKENIQFSRDTEFVKKNLVNHFSILEETENAKVELTGLDEREPIETRRYTIKSSYTIHMKGSVEMLNLVDGKACIIESTNNSFQPFVVHYAETFIIPAEVGEYTVRAIEGPVMLIQARIR